MGSVPMANKNLPTDPMRVAKQHLSLHISLVEHEKSILPCNVYAYQNSFLWIEELKNNEYNTCHWKPADYWPFLKVNSSPKLVIKNWMSYSIEEWELEGGRDRIILSSRELAAIVGALRRRQLYCYPPSWFEEFLFQLYGKFFFQQLWDSKRIMDSQAWSQSHDSIRNSCKTIS